jgi:hypothetical protein
MTVNQGYINHIAMVLDASGSMRGLEADLIKVADSQIEYLAERSKQLDQETRITVYMFGDTVQCLFYDKDVLRMPSIAKHYRLQGLTALVDATLQSLNDLAKTPELYGDHAFLVYVLTDGMENRSRNSPAVLTQALKNLRDNWTVAVLVPDQRSVFEAKRFGFPTQNIAVWDTTTSQGVREVGAAIREATDRFMEARKTGLKGSKNVFATDAITKETVKLLDAIDPSTYSLIPVLEDCEVKKFVEETCGLKFKLGNCYYQLIEAVTIQPDKKVCVLEKKTGKLYGGPQARALIGLTDVQMRAKPAENKEYTIFVQSKAINRKLRKFTQLLMFNA